MISLLLWSQGAAGQESPHGPMNLACQTCHMTDSWKVGNNLAFDHASTGFKLVGQHASVPCVACHSDLKFSDARPGCATCHNDVHKSELGGNCLNCHTMQAWKITDMTERHQETRFTLLGKHRVLTCESCHHNAANYQYRGSPVECVGCHTADYTATTNPNHATAGFSTDCVACHSVTSYTWDHSFDHNTTSFPLTGAHLATPCSNCHVNGAFKGTPSQCVSCHRPDFAGATNPNHIQGGFSTNCTQCHTTTAWQPAAFNHSTTNFPLTGEHVRVQCQTCHTNGNYNLTYTGCNQCHNTNFDATTNPNHLSQNFGRTCETCHSTTAWQPATFNHNTTKFPLTGAHVSVQCQTCHTNGNYNLTYTGCNQCHNTNFDGTTNPNHVSLNLSRACETCHTTTNWTSSTFSHDAPYFKIYSGAHQGNWTQCTDCHTTNDVATFSCIDCHAHPKANTDSHHAGVNGYIYASPSCYSCHRGV